MAARVTQSFLVAGVNTPANARVTQSFIVVGVGLGIVCNNPPGGNIGVPYTHTFLAGSGNPPFLFSISAGFLPPGLALNSATGVVTGVPTTAGGFTFTVTVTDTFFASASVQCSITIAAVSNSVIITFYGWKLYPLSPCDDAVEGEEVPPVERAL